MTHESAVPHAAPLDLVVSAEAPGDDVGDRVERAPKTRRVIVPSLVTTRDRIAAQRHGRWLLGPHRLAIPQRSTMQFWQAPLGASTVFGMSFQESATIHPNGPADHFTVCLVLTGGHHVKDLSWSATLHPGQVGIVQPSSTLRIEVQARSSVLGVRIPATLFQRHLAVITGRAYPEASWVKGVIPSSPAADIAAAMIKQYAGSVERTAQLTRGAGDAVESSLMTAVLLALPDVAASPRLRRSMRPSTEEAVTYLRMSSPQFPSPHEVAQRVGLSLRRLQAGFQRDLGMTPSTFIRQLRLDAAHDMLTSGDCDSVIEAASFVEMDHLGRFSAHYRRRFGVLPSETLRRARSTSMQTGR
jgi:AraC-like DNA-binding protein